MILTVRRFFEKILIITYNNRLPNTQFLKNPRFVEISGYFAEKVCLKNKMYVYNCG